MRPSDRRRNNDPTLARKIKDLKRRGLLVKEPEATPAPIFQPRRPSNPCQWSAFCMDPAYDGSPFCLGCTLAALDLGQASLPPRDGIDYLIAEIDEDLADRLFALEEDDDEA